MTLPSDPKLRQAIEHTAHCLIGCGVGEIVGMAIAALMGWHKVGRLLLALGLAFLFGYSLTYRGVRKHTSSVKQAVRLTVAADTISITAMEIVDNTLELLIPNALIVSVASFRFWWGLAVSLSVAFLITVPINRYMLGHSSHHA